MGEVSFSDPSIRASEKTFSGEGKVIGKGKSTNRVEITEIQDPRMRIVAKTITNPEERGFLTRLMDKIKYVKVKGELHVNIGSLSRLGISASEARSAAKEGTLENLIQERAPMMKAKLDKYDIVLDKYAEKKHVMHSKDGSVATGLKKRELQKVIRIGLTRVPTTGKVLSFSKAQVLVQQINGEGPRFIAKPMSSSAFLGEGAFGVAYRVVDIFEATPHAMKLAKVEISLVDDDAKRNARAAADVKNEAKLLQYIGEQRGVQRPPSHQAFTIEKPEWVGFVGHLYSGSLDKVPPFGDNKEAAMECGHQLFCGLATLEDKGVMLGDIKAANILVTIDENTKLPKEVALSDLGGAKLASKLKAKEHALGTHTPGYYTESDKTMATEAGKELGKEKFVELQHKRDVFATTKTLLQQITGNKQPFKITEEGYAQVPPDKDLKKHLNALLKGYPPEVVAFFSRNLSANPDNRFSPKVALQEYEGIISKQFPDLKTELVKDNHLRYKEA